MAMIGRMLLLFLAALTGTLVAAVVQSSLRMTIAHINDHHSFLLGDDFTLLAAASGASTNANVSVGGFPRLVALMKQLRIEAESFGRPFLRLHAGDALVGTSFYTAYRGEADAAMMQEFCFDAFGLGNHEFDDGDASLAHFIRSLQNSTICPGTPVLAANLVPGPTSPLLALQQSGSILPNKVFDYNGELVGVIGINIRNKTLLSSSPDDGTTLLDERETAAAQVAELEALGVNKIILLTHIGYANDLEWMANNIPGVDVVVGGDSHSLLGESNEIVNNNPVVGPYPTLAGDGRLVCVVQAWEYGRALGRLDLLFDPSGNVLGCGGNPIFPYEIQQPLSEADETVVNRYLTGLGSSYVRTTPDPDTTAVLQPFVDGIGNALRTVIATVPQDICHERIPSTSELCGGVCNLVAQAFLDQVPNADVAIQNAGGCITDIRQGDFTIENAYELLPFSNTLFTLVMTGEQIQLVLEQAVDFAGGAYPYAAGLRYRVDLGLPFGERVFNVEVNPRLAGVWMPLDTTATYTVLTNSFLISGHDGYLAFADADAIVNTYLEYATVFVDYAIAQGTLVDPPRSTYSTQSFSDGVPTASPVPSMVPTAIPSTLPSLRGTPTPAPTVRRTPFPTPLPTAAPITPRPTPRPTTIVLTEAPSDKRMSMMMGMKHR